MLTRVLAGAGILLGVGLLVLYLFGTGFGIEPWHAEEPEGAQISPEVVAARAEGFARDARKVGVAQPKQILFGDLHVHTTFSFDAFQMSLPMAGGDGAHPVADACDYARHCAALDFWSINDHAVSLTPRRWSETIESIRQCNEVSGSDENPDLVTYLGWEWTQVGMTPETHWGHKNVILRDLEEDAIPSHPISAGVPVGMPSVQDSAPSPFLVGAFALLERDRGGLEVASYLSELNDVFDCPSGVPVRELPTDCRDTAPTPEQLFARLDDWGHEAMVIPHGTTWGFYTPMGSAWDKQLTPAQHDPNWQGVIEVFSGHGNSEEFRSYQNLVIAEDGSRSCPEPTPGFLPSCWRAGEIIEARCLLEEESAEECAGRAATARQHYVDADRNGGSTTVPATTVSDWQDSGQCRDCFQPSFNSRPKSSVQYILSLGRPDAPAGKDRFRFGFIASSDNHSARPGTGYKEVARTEFTETRFGNFLNTPLGEGPDEDPEAESHPFDGDVGAAVFSIFETERQASFFLNGGLAAVHSNGRDRNSIWESLRRREIYGTSGPRILLWFDLLNAPGGSPTPMGSEVSLSEGPIFQVRAVGSFEQKPGCPADAIGALASERLDRLCQGECYHPSDRRRPISRIEVVRIRPQTSAGEPAASLIEDPWKVLPCAPDPSGCQVAFADDDHARDGRDSLYYVRAIEAPSLAVGVNPLGCTRDENDRCVELEPCFGRPDADECLAETEERAWSSPIFVNQPQS